MPATRHASSARSAGIGLRRPHRAEILDSRPAVGWLEVHAENYMCGGPELAALRRVRADHAVALHAVGLSVGNAGGPDERHLRRLCRLAAAIEPMLVSEHLAWSGIDGSYLNDLLPLPYTEATLRLAVAQVGRTQEALRRQLLVENPSTYLRFRDDTIPEGEFLAELARRSGCGLLLDVNNLYVNARNHGGDPLAVLDALPPEAVAELHLAGHAVNDADGVEVLIDDHGAPVAEAVWHLHAAAVRRFPQAVSLVEWDTALPPLAELLAEAAEADFRRAAALAGEARHAEAG